MTMARLTRDTAEDPVGVAVDDYAVRWERVQCPC
jgi:hypothetical protein